MKKKILLIMLCISACIACALGVSACNLFESNDGGEHTHTLVHYGEKAATCSVEGNREYWYCNSCGSYFSDENGENKVTVSSLKIEKTAHTEEVDEAVPFTCTENGLTEGKHCSVCSEVIVAQEVIPARHIEVIIPAVEKTCTLAGSTQGQKCGVCNTVTVKPEIIPASHTLVTDEGYEETCTEDGLTEGKHCEKCSYVEVQTVIPAKGHTEVDDDAVEPTCTEDGKTAGKHCSDCSYVFVEQEIIPATGHTEVTDAAVAAGCLTQGKTEGKHCSVCHTVLVAQEVISAKGHKEVIDPAVEATCSEEGLTAGKHCSECNTVLVAQRPVAKLSHTGSGNICSTCGTLMVAASVGLEFREITEMPTVTGYSLRSNVTVIGVEVTGRGSCTDANIVIPATHNGLQVLGIADTAFCPNGNEDLTIRTLTVPNGVKYIGDGAFSYCTNLVSVDLADTVEEMGDAVFRGTGITTFKCPAKLKALGGKMFVGCMNLRTVIVNVITEKFYGLDACVAFGYTPNLTDVFFEGTRAQWDVVSNEGDTYHEDEWWDSTDNWTHYPAHDTRINFYSATAPTTAGNYWHYDADGNPVRW